MILPFKIDPSVTVEKDALLYQTNFEEFFSEANTNTAWRGIKPYIEQAVEDYILPQIGEALYNDLLTKYHADTALTPAQARCLRLIQTTTAWCSVAYAYVNKLDILTDIGNTQATAEKAVSTPQWAFNKKYGNLLRTADKKLDSLLEFLEKQAAAKVTYFELWYLDEAYLRDKADLFHTTAEMLRFHNILNSRRTFVALIPSLRDVARVNIIPAIGLEMYNELVTQHKTATLTVANNALLDYARAAALKLALANALDTQPIAFESDGIRAVSTTEGIEKLNIERINQLSKNCLHIGKQFLDDLVTFLFKNADQYPTFKNSQSYPSDTPVVSRVKISADGVGAVML